MPSLVRKLLGLRHTYVLIAALFLTLAQIFMAGRLTASTSQVMVSTYLLLFCLLLRPIYWPVALLIGLLVTWFLTFANDSKIALTQMPLTFIDFAIFSRDPGGLFNALRLSQTEIVALLVGTASVALLAAWILFHTCWNPKLVFPGSRTGAALFQAGSVVIFLSLFSVFSRAYVRSVHDYLQKARFPWSPAGVARLSDQLGIYGFLLYSQALDKIETGVYFTAGLNSQPPTPQEIADAVTPYVHLHPVPPDKLPNLMIVLAESTFDFNQAFKLTHPVANFILDRNENTRALGPVYANAVGGGTWLSEFETVVGIDERLFGYAGYYTHSSLSPFVKTSVVTYLEKKGYSTIALYPTEGTFYNTKVAFKKYGFDRFMEAQELGLKGHWSSTDEEIAEAVVSRGGLEHLKAPFFAYVDFLENHAPHRCDKFTSQSELFTTFADPASFEQNCILNEFIRRAKSSEAGFRMLVSYMQDTQQRTGRPYVIMIFGDHQPHTFTSTESAWSKFDYTSFRTPASPRQTFFHVISSIPDVLECCHTGIPHLSLLPTLLSAYTAEKPEELYLGVNFYVYRNCGPDLLTTRASGVFASTSPDGSVKSKNCSVFDKVLSVYHRDHLF